MQIKSPHKFHPEEEIYNSLMLYSIFSGLISWSQVFHSFLSDEMILSFTNWNTGRKKTDCENRLFSFK